MTFQLWIRTQSAENEGFGDNDRSLELNKGRVQIHDGTCIKK